jgi:hypothetical protein
MAHSESMFEMLIARDCQPPLPRALSGWLRCCSLLLVCRRPFLEVGKKLENLQPVTRPEVPVSGLQCPVPNCDLLNVGLDAPARHM